jgi:hypothetical protein
MGLMGRGGKGGGGHRPPLRSCRRPAARRVPRRFAYLCAIPATKFACTDSPPPAEPPAPPPAPPLPPLPPSIACTPPANATFFCDAASCYTYVAAPLSWQRALDSCKAMSGSLVVFRTFAHQMQAGAAAAQPLPLPTQSTALRRCRAAAAGCAAVNHAPWCAVGAARCLQGSGRTPLPFWLPGALARTAA